MASLRYSTGLGLILVVVLIWVASAEVTQDIFNAYDHPFTITWLGASLLSLLLPMSWIRDRFKSKTAPRLDNSRKEGTPEPEESFTFSPIAPGVDSRRRDISPKGRIKDIELQPLVYKSPSSSDKPEEDSFWRKGMDRLRRSIKKVSQTDSWEVIHIALYLAPMWFMVEYFANASLALTSVANTTIISSSAGLWTLLFSVALGQDKFNAMKLIAVIVTIGGVVMTTLGSSWTTSELLANKASKTVPDARHPTHVKQKNDNLSGKTLMGDALSLTSAICYGFFTVQLKKFAGEEGEGGEEKMDVQKVFGYMGVISLLGLWWVVVPLHALGIEPAFKLPATLRMDEYLLANGLVGSMVSDYFWALAVVWTTPVVATLGMSLTIPVAMVSDVILHGRHFSSVYILGALQVFAGFCVANLDDRWMQYMGFS